MHRKLFFDTSEAIADRLTETFDFVWSTATAQWNLRWQVDGFLRASPEATDDELKSRFALGSGVRGANLRRSCVQHSWPHQQEMFAKILLIEFCALYEAWIEGVLDELGHNNSRHVKNLQFPTTPTGGISRALAALTANISNELQKCIYPVLIKNKKNSYSKIESLLVCYRYFKEVRNSIIHHSGVATEKTLDAYDKFKLETTSSLGVKEIPKHAAISAIGDNVKLDLRGVVGFGDIVLKLVTTFDAELSQTTEAELIFEKRWVKAIGKMKTLPADNKDKTRVISTSVRKIGLEMPENPLILLIMLQRRKLVASI